MPKVTIRDVAKYAGVGVGTVSRVLNHSEQVSEETRHRVLNVIEELGFRPDTVARQLARKTRFQYIGVITRPFIYYDSFTARLRGVQKVLQRYQDYEMMLFTLSHTRDYDERLMSILTTRTIDGLLIIDLNLSTKQKETLQMANLPFVGLNHFSAHDWVCIGTDNVVGAHMATQHLIQLGHQRIGYVGDYIYDHAGFITGAERYEGYERALMDSGLPVDPDITQFGEFGFEAAKVMMDNLLQVPDPPTAIFAMSDTQAFGCIESIRQAGLSVPEDISVIGYDNIEGSHYGRLTTVTQHLELSGTLGTEYLLQMMHGKLPKSPPRLPSPHVIKRDSTAPPKSF